MKTQIYESIGSYLRIVKLDYASGESKYVIQIKEKHLVVSFVRHILFGRKIFGWDYLNKKKNEFGQISFPTYSNFDDAKKVVDEFVADFKESEIKKKSNTIIKKTIM